MSPSEVLCKTVFICVASKILPRNDIFTRHVLFNPRKLAQKREPCMDLTTISTGNDLLAKKDDIELWCVDDNDSFGFKP